MTHQRRRAHPLLRVIMTDEFARLRLDAQEGDRIGLMLGDAGTPDAGRVKMLKMPGGWKLRRIHTERARHRLMIATQSLLRVGPVRFGSAAPAEITFPERGVVHFRFPLSLLVDKNIMSDQYAHMRASAGQWRPAVVGPQR